MTVQETATEALNEWFKSSDKVTTLEFKNYLIAEYPGIYWTQQWVSAFLQATDLEFTDNGRYRTYTKPAVLEVQNILEVCQKLTSANIDITKRKIKVYLHGQGLPLQDFEEVFKQAGLKHTGKYTGDNKKIWAVVPTGKHFSKGKGNLVAIKDMPKPYLRNAIAKYVADYGQPDMHYILGQQDSEFYKLLQAYFTWEIRNAV